MMLPQEIAGATDLSQGILFPHAVQHVFGAALKPNGDFSAAGSLQQPEQLWIDDSREQYALPGNIQTCRKDLRTDVHRIGWGEIKGVVDEIKIPEALFDPA
jgi:hypothetical protein